MRSSFASLRRDPNHPFGLDRYGAIIRRGLGMGCHASMSRTTLACHLINAAYLAGEPVRWSEERNDIEGDAGKGTLSYRREYRGPWELPEYA